MFKLRNKKVDFQLYALIWRLDFTLAFLFLLAEVVDEYESDDEEDEEDEVSIYNMC